MFCIQAKFSDFFFIYVYIYTGISFKEQGMEQFQNTFIKTLLYYTYHLGYKCCLHSHLTFATKITLAYHVKILWGKF